MLALLLWSLVSEVNVGEVSEAIENCLTLREWERIKKKRDRSKLILQKMSASE